MPNPGGQLLPGMFVRVRLEQAKAGNAMLLPLQSVTRSPQGDTVMVVGADGKVARRTVKIGGSCAGQWIVLEGLQPGEQVMVDGFQKLRPNQSVKPVPWSTARAATAPAAAASQAARCMAKFFIDRPIFAWVIALFIVVLGSVAITQLPVAQYPPVAPPSIVISASYPGVSAKTLEESVISVIEQEMNGSSGLIYMESVTQANGSGQITLRFQPGTNPDLAQVDVQSRLARAAPRLPQAVTQQGVRVDKARSNFLLFAILSSKDSTWTPVELGDYASRSVLPEIQRVPGVGQAHLFGTEQAMRVWIDPQKLVAFNLSAAEVTAAIRSQNAQVSSGSIGELPNVAGQGIAATVTLDGQLSSVEQFRNLVAARQQRRLQRAPEGRGARRAECAELCHIRRSRSSSCFYRRWSGTDATLTPALHPNCWPSVPRRSTGSCRMRDIPPRRARGEVRATAPPYRRSVPIRTVGDWNDPPLGYVEADFVAHCGSQLSGSFIQTLVLIDIASGWTECIPVLTRDSAMVTDAISTARRLLPFPLRGLDFDNDSVFMNGSVVGWYLGRGIEVTRARAYRKNDQA